MGLKEELLLALLPTLTILVVLSLVEVLGGQRLLFASLASSAFLIYLDPQHGTNRIRTLLGAHLGSACVGVLMDFFLGAGYPAAGAAMAISIIMMITLDIVHPPAISTTLGFAFRSGEQENFDLFLLAVLIVAILVLLQRAVLYILGHLTQGHEPPQAGPA
ncbi:HPP family protein [Candidatus Laterigemmans baculatus]|uniref:HPP family protein n=1 Tax=Candidatus Laterigemmans baculatus TaxID=2770505 RepID=UPI0013DAACAF|nr:HPP family protein [Candidatus Laterigemmans baculatus]